MKAIGIALALACAASLSFAAGTDDLWEVTTQMNVPGMPPGMGGNTSQQCYEKDMRKNVTKGKNAQGCTVTDYKESGNKITITMSCKNNRSAVMEYVFNPGRTEYKGTMRMKDGGRDMVMNMSGRKIGACDAQQAKSEREQARSEREGQIAAMKAQADAARAQGEQARKQAFDAQIAECSKAVDTMDMGKLGMYGRCYKKSDDTCKTIMSNAAMTSPEVRSACTAKAAEFCKRYQTQDGFAKARGDKNAAEMCGLSADQVKASLCPGAAKAESLDFVGRYCPNEAKPLAKKYCTGRDYTSRDGGKYAALCSSYALESTTPQRPASSGQSTPAKSAVQQGVDQGVNKLRGLFGR
ncbi:MAG TPA: DUF3617 family protein [Burkholderiales bacterium]|nr:DUF3617 family protein [Burkholderiales bacterium]